MDETNVSKGTEAELKELGGEWNRQLLPANEYERGGCKGTQTGFEHGCLTVH
jgi:hypothetical protein